MFSYLSLRSQTSVTQLDTSLHHATPLESGRLGLFQWLQRSHNKFCFLFSAIFSRNSVSYFPSQSQICNTTPSSMPTFIWEKGKGEGKNLHPSEFFTLKSLPMELPNNRCLQLIGSWEILFLISGTDSKQKRRGGKVLVSENSGFQK